MTDTTTDTVSASETLTTLTPKQEALRGLPPEWREALIEQASAMGIRADGDIAWLLVKSFINAWAGAAATGDRLKEVQEATAKIGDTIFTQTVRAGEDLKSLVSAGIRETTIDVGKKIGNAIQTVTQRGVEQIKEAAGELDQTAREQLSVTIQEYKGNLARAARQEAEKMSAFMGAVRWGVIISAIFGSLSFGMVNGYMGYRYIHSRHISPASLQMYRQPNGAYIAAFSGRFGVQRIQCEDTLCLRITPAR